MDYDPMRIWCVTAWIAILVFVLARYVFGISTPYSCIVLLIAWALSMAGMCFYAWKKDNR